MTNTDICNMALSHIAKGSIRSVKDNTEAARQCNLHYEHLREMLLREYTWGFAKRIIQMAELDKKIPGWKHCYAYPEKCICIRFVFDEQNANGKDFERAEYDVILVSDNVKAVACNIEQAYAEYTYDATDVEMFSPEFVEALSRHLASSIAMTLTGSAAIQQAQYQLFQIALQKAKLSTAKEKEKETRYPDKYAQARFS